MVEVKEAKSKNAAKLKAKNTTETNKKVRMLSWRHAKKEV